MLAIKSDSIKFGYNIIGGQLRFSAQGRGKTWRESWDEEENVRRPHFKKWEDKEWVLLLPVFSQFTFLRSNPTKHIVPSHQGNPGIADTFLGIPGSHMPQGIPNQRKACATLASRGCPPPGQASLPCSFLSLSGVTPGCPRALCMAVALLLVVWWWLLRFCSLKGVIKWTLTL